MQKSTLTALVLLIMGCGGSSDTTSGQRSEVEALSRAAVEVDTPNEPVSYPPSLLDEAVPMASQPVEPIDELPALEQTEQPTVHFSLRRGETLAHFARWAELPVEDIAETSNLSLDGAYAVGTDVVIELNETERDRVQGLRDQHRARRIAGYLASRGGSLGTEVISVRTGESAWTIARHSQGIPVWLLESFNPGVDLEALHPGDQLKVPVIADVVVDAEDTADIEEASTTN